MKIKLGALRRIIRETVREASAQPWDPQDPELKAKNLPVLKRLLSQAPWMAQDPRAYSSEWYQMKGLSKRHPLEAQEMMAELEKDKEYQDQLKWIEGHDPDAVELMDRLKKTVEADAAAVPTAT